MNSTASACPGADDWVGQFGPLIRFAGASADATPIPLPAAPGPSSSWLLLSPLAQETAFGFLAVPENAATTPNAWARDLGNGRCTMASDARVLVVPDKVSRAPFVLEQAQLASRSRAYVVFDGLLSSEEGVLGVTDHLAAFLSNPDSKHRDALLACFADREVELEAGPLMTAVAQLLTATDSRTRRMAALALAGGGAVGEAELGKGLDALSVEWAEDIRATLRLSA